MCFLVQGHRRKSAGRQRVADAHVIDGVEGEKRERVGGDVDDRGIRRSTSRPGPLCLAEARQRVVIGAAVERTRRALLHMRASRDLPHPRPKQRQSIRERRRCRERADESRADGDAPSTGDPFDARDRRSPEDEPVDVGKSAHDAPIGRRPQPILQLIPRFPRIRGQRQLHPVRLRERCQRRG